jgi:hypothetical protein
LNACQSESRECGNWILGQMEGDIPAVFMAEHLAIYKEGGVYFELEPDFVMFHEDLNGWYHCLLTVKYTIKGNHYVSLTAFSIFQDQM